MYFVIGADIVPTERNSELFITGDVISLVGEKLKNTLDNAAYRIFNLEVPLSDRMKPILKQGPNLIASTMTIQGYKALGIDLLTLANNHILDHDTQGVESTIEVLDRYGISHLGAGKNLVEASKPFVFCFNGKRIGVYSCTEHEFSIATEEKPGANPFDPLYSLDHVTELKKTVDYMIVLYHGGKEYYRYPSPNLQKVCRRLVDKGADLVICQHSHCIGCEERYKESVIVYGQGNFIFDNCDNEYWNTSLLIKVDENLSVTYVPIVKQQHCVRLADYSSANIIMSDFYKRSEEICNKDFVREKYDEYSEMMFYKYFKLVKGKESILFRALNKMTRGMINRCYFKSKYDTGRLIALSNYIECEAHRELILRGIQRKIEKTIFNESGNK